MTSMTETPTRPSHREAAHTTVIPDALTYIHGRGYRYQGKTWVSLDIDGALGIQTADDIESMQRLADTILSAIAQARQAEQDEAVSS